VRRDGDWSEGERPAAQAHLLDFILCGVPGQAQHAVVLSWG
jgi:hypothetical protein